VALAVLDEIQRPGFLESVTHVGEILGRGLEAAATEAPGVVEVRGAGMMWGVELREDRAQDAVDDLRERGVLACAAGPRVLRLLPPLILGAEEAEEGLQAVAATLKEVAS
jgi:acetylornithine/succinyldiaminopimelate/putrescine aminotransferase